MTEYPKVTPLEYARKMVAAYAAQGWEVERAWWQRKVEELEITEYPKGGFQVVFNGTDYQVQRYHGQVVTYCEKLEDAEEYCRLLNATRRRNER